MSALVDPVHDTEALEVGTRFQRGRQRLLKILTVGLLGMTMLIGTTTVVSTVTALPAEAVTVGGEFLPPQIYLYFNKSESASVGGAANTGFTVFVATFCGLIPGGSKLYPIRAGCAVGGATSYARLGELFKQARREGKCVRVSYPVGFPLPNPSPNSRVYSC